MESECENCGDGSGWIWDDVYKWVACADCNDDCKKPKPSHSTFECAKCGGVFEKNRSDSDVDVEAMALFGFEDATLRANAFELDYYCDDCFKAVYVIA